MSTSYRIEVRVNTFTGEQHYEVVAGRKTVACRTLAEAEALVAEMEQAAAARQAKVDAWGERLTVSYEGLTKAQAMRGMRRYAVTDGDTTTVYDSLNEVPMPADDAPVAVTVAEAETMEVAPAAEVVRGTITDAQAEQIMALIADGAHEEGGFYAGPTTRAEVATMTKADASTYISSLTGRY